MNTTSFRAGATVRSLPCVAAIAAVVIGASAAAAVQANRPHLTLSGGIAEYDLGGTGTTGVWAIGASFPLTSFLSIDPALGYLEYGNQGGSDVGFLLPEVSARLQVPGKTINPFLAIGGGLAPVVKGAGETDVTLHAAVGTYVWLTRSWALRPEARVRGIEPFVGTTADLTFGVTRRL